MSLDELLAQRIKGMGNPTGGPYKMTTYTWESKELESNVTDIVLNPTTNVLFDNRTEQNLVGFSFRVYVPANGSKSFASGIAIAANTSLVLDGYMASGASFEARFNLPAYERTLHNVTIATRDTVMDQRNRTLAIYRFDSDYVE